MIALGHLVRRHGRDADAAEMLEQAAKADPGDVDVVRNLVDLHRMAGRMRKALQWAEHLAEQAPDDELALLDLAELYLDANEHDAARATFDRLRHADVEPGRQIVAYHGMIEAEIRAGPPALGPGPGRRRDGGRPQPRHDRRAGLRRDAGLRPRRPSGSDPEQLQHALAAERKELPHDARAGGGGSVSREEAQWLKCPNCDAFVYRKRLDKNLKVCPDCAFHFRIGVDERLAQLLDEGSWEQLSKGIESHDVLGFVDSKPYPERLAQARAKTGRDDAGRLRGRPHRRPPGGHRRPWTSRSWAGRWAARSGRSSPARPSTPSTSGCRC